MKTRRMKIAAAIALLAAFALGGAAFAGAGGTFDNEESLKGNELEQASAAALKATGGGTVNETERDSEKGAVYEVEVTKPDGSTVDVRLDGSYGVVVIDSDSEEADEGDGEEQADEDDGEESLQGNERTQAEAAALKATGGGTVKGSERVSEEGGVTFKVDVTKPDGSTVDVELDASYGVVATDSDSEPDDADDEGGEE